MRTQHTKVSKQQVAGKYPEITDLEADYDYADAGDEQQELYLAQTHSSARVVNRPAGNGTVKTFQQGNKQFVVHQTPIPYRKSRGQEQHLPPSGYAGYLPPTTNTEEPAAKTGRHPHWLLYVGFLLLIMTAGWVAFSALANWWQVTQDDLHFGRPRTFQMDAVVGHFGDSAQTPSHFLALNLNRHVQIVEFPAGDGSKARIYFGPVLLGAGQDLTPVTLSFKDVNGDGHVDMLIHIDGSTIVFINDVRNNKFRPATESDHLTG